jgi:hypothetical protein
MKTKPQKIYIVTGSFLSCVLLACGLIVKTGKIKSYELYKHPELQILYKYSPYDLTKTRITKCFLDANLKFSKYDEQCYLSNLPNQIFVLGDSQAAHLFQMMPEYSSSGTFLGQLNMSGCPPFFDLKQNLDPSCIEANKEIKKILSSTKNISKVVMLSNWIGRSKEIKNWKFHLQKTISFLKSIGVKEIYLVGPFPQLDKNLPTFVSETLRNHNKFPEYYETSHFDYIEHLDEEFSNLASINGIKFISLLNLLCSNRKCRTTTPDQELITYDLGHLTLGGSRFVLERNLDIFRF